MTRTIPLLHFKEVRGYAIVDDDDFAGLAEFRWALTGNGYASRKTAHDPAKRSTTVLMHRQILGLTRRDEVGDHINGNHLDNRRSNLRAVTWSGNSQNKTRLNRNNTSGYRGVYYDAKYNRWRAACDIDGQRRYLGCFDTAREAHDVVCAFRADHMPFAAHRSAV